MAYRSAITGRYVDKATAARHPKMTIKETVKRPGRKAGGASKDKLKK
ncbi:multidrug transporter [Deinococcus sp. SDU3-2]|uniref:Multidrug transporter n=1 Tax=Deinococcus terrestris TaxID=2651870 RepID=A0A7X1NY45_9DEIO|nr:multidrug transporter [Deinococcus terrestris]